MWQIKKRILATVIRSEVKRAFNSKAQTLLIAVGVVVCVAYLAALKRRRALTIDSSQPSDAVELEAIAALAYRIWRDRGCPYGSDKEDWFRAEQELKRTR
jgi:hypothetical protein